MQLGSWQLESVDGGHFWLDGGVMHGIVPKTVWQAVTPPDHHNRVPLAVRCVLARNGTQNVLVDTGYGGKLSPLERNAYAAGPGNPLIESLAALGVSPREIDVVVFTHLHWDHAGGATHFESDRKAVPTFPNATHFVNRLEWEDATSGLPELGGYAAANHAPLEAAGQLVLVEGETEIVPGLWTRPTGGHTRGHQAFLFESQGETALFPGDLCPVVPHLRPMWSTAYDHFPLETRRRKQELLSLAAEQGWWILWDHDPNVAVSRVARHKNRDFVPVDAREVL